MQVAALEDTSVDMVGSTKAAGYKARPRAAAASTHAAHIVHLSRRAVELSRRERFSAFLRILRKESTLGPPTGRSLPGLEHEGTAVEGQNRLEAYRVAGIHLAGDLVVVVVFYFEISELSPVLLSPINSQQCAGLFADPQPNALVPKGTRDKR